MEDLRLAHIRTGARSWSPVNTSWPLAAANVRSDASHPAFGPVRPNGEIDTATSNGFSANQPIDVERNGSRFDQHVGRPTKRSHVDAVEGHRLLAPVVRQMPQALLVLVALLGRVLQERADPPGRRPLRRLDEDDLGAQLSEQERGEVAAVVGQVEHSVR